MLNYYFIYFIYVHSQGLKLPRDIAKKTQIEPENSYEMKNFLYH